MNMETYLQQVGEESSFKEKPRGKEHGAED
jgi:hypothetical protein